MKTEFQFLDSLRTKYSLPHIGDDCAVLPKDSKTDLLLTADLLIEDIDFRLAWSTPEQLGHKALAVSLSDIAAMGGKAVWAMLSLGVPENIWNTDFIDRFYNGWFELARKYNVELVGGDISRSPDKMVIDSIVGGEAGKGKAILRSTAKPGDAIFVSGFLGGAAAGLRLLESGLQSPKNRDNLDRNLLLKQLQPLPQLDHANILCLHGIASSMIDISDGLSSDLSHICKQSGVGARLEAEMIPIDANISLDIPSTERFELALNGGEDFELLFTVEKKNISLLDSLGVTRIGEVTANTGIIELMRDGKAEILEPKGYVHF